MPKPFADFLTRRGILAAAAICLGIYLANGSPTIAVFFSLLVTGLVAHWFLTGTDQEGGRSPRR